MTDFRLYPNTLFGRNRDEPEIWQGYVSADEGTISALTVLTLAETHHIGPTLDADKDIVFDVTNKEIDLKAGNYYEFDIGMDQAGASSLIDIYNVTGTAVLWTHALQEGFKSVRYRYYATANISVSLRADDQTANSVLATTGWVHVTRLGRVKT